MKLLKKSLLYITGGVTTILLTFACKKEQVQSTTVPDESGYYPNVGSFRSLTLPTVKDGMLKFSDQIHLDDYVDYLDAIIMDEPQSEFEEDTDLTEMDAKLLAVESNIGFNSLRAQLVADFELLNEEGFETLADIPEPHFIGSSSIQSVLNTNYEVQVGNSIWVYYNEKYMLEITDGNLAKRDAIRTYRISSPNEIHPEIYFMSGVVPHGNGATICHLPVVSTGNTAGGGSGSGGGSGGGSANDTTWMERGEHTPRNCEPFIIDFVYELSVEVTDGLSSVVPARDAMTGTTLVWDFGDGSPTQTVQDDGVISHTYTDTGTYYVTVTVTHNGVLGFGTYSSVYAFDPITVNGAQCTEDDWNEYSADPNTGAKRVELNSSLAYEWAVLGFQYPDDSFRDKVVSRIKSYRYINGKWRYRKVDRLATIMTGQIRTNEQCNTINVNKACWPHNARCAETVYKWQGYYIDNDDIHSDQRIWHNTDYNQDIQDLPTVCN